MENRKKMLVELNRRHSEMFMAQRLERELYLAQHPTKIVVFKCMDGRVHMPTVTKTPLGIMRPFRNIGGKFDLGWPYLNEAFDQLVTKAVSEGKRVLVLVNYHFSAGDKQRGCAGFGHDKEASMRFTENFRQQILRIYGKDNGVVVPIRVGLETDRDTLIFHGDGGKQIDVSTLSDDSDGALRLLFRELYPSMPDRVLADLLPLVQGNMGRIAETSISGKPSEDLVHGEWILAIGKGFDWLHAPNMALIVGPYDPNVGEPIATAADIVGRNVEAGRAPDGFVLLSSSIFTDAEERVRAKERSLYLNRLGREIIGKRHPELIGLMHPMPVILDYATMQMEVVEE
ncbi:MAG: hypothetical protein HGB18_02710 [Candidatus Moranbacteria bacterium]|nr:hypothetical protein [Candidatus Moranbacteria bacterium]